MCVWPPSTTDSSVPSNDLAASVSGVTGVKMSSSLSGVAWQQRTPPSRSTSITNELGHAATAARRSGPSRARHQRLSSPSSSSTIRSALPPSTLTRSPSALSRSKHSAGNVPATTSPRTTTSSAATQRESASTASSACRFPWMSASAAICTNPSLGTPGLLQLEHRQAQLVCTFHRGEGDGEILDCQPGAVEGRDVGLGQTTGRRLAEHVAELCHILTRDRTSVDGVNEFPVVARLLPVVTEDASAGELGNCDLGLARPVGAHQAHVLAG